MKRTVAVSLAVLLAACGSASPTGPAGIPPPPAAYSLSGTVFETMPGGPEPVEGVSVQIAGSAQRATTDHSGAYTIRGLPAMNTSVLASRVGYVTDTRGIAIRAHTQLNIQIVRIQRYVLSGVVTRATPSGEVPFVGLDIYCDSCGEAGHSGVTTDANGFYSFPWVYAGVHQFQVLTQDYRDPNEKFAGVMVSEVTVRGDTEFNIRMVPR